MCLYMYMTVDVYMISRIKHDWANIIHILRSAKEQFNLHFTKILQHNQAVNATSIYPFIEQFIKIVHKKL